MSKAAKQVVHNTIFSYIGVAVGAISIIYFVPEVFGDEKSAENYGGILVLLNYVALFVFLSVLSSPRTLINFYPNYSSQEREKLLATLFWYQIIGLIISFIIFSIVSDNILITVNSETLNISPYFYPLLFLFTLNSFLFSYSQVIEKTIFPTFLRDSFVKIWNFFILLSLYFEMITFKVFMFLYLFQFLVQFVLLAIYISKRKKDKFNLWDFSFIIHPAVLNYTLFSLLTGAAATLVTKVDIQMIKSMINQEVVAYYSFGLYFISVLTIPRNSITTISNFIISRDFNLLPLHQFKEKYLRISFIYTFSTLVVFLLILLGIEELMIIVGGKYGSETIRNVVLILGIGRVIESMFIVNTSLITFSRYYKYDIIYQILSMVLVIVLNVIFINLYNLLGAAISTSVVFISIAILRTIFIKRKVNLFPVTKKYLFSIFLISLLGLLYFIPTKEIFSLTLLNSQFFPYFSIIIKTVPFIVLLWFIMIKRGIRKEFFKVKKNI